MSISQSQQIDLCCPNKKVYTVIYSEKDKDDTIQKVCTICFNIELKSKNQPDRLIRPYQREVTKIICISCNENVTESMWCDTCHPNSMEEKS